MGLGSGGEGKADAKSYLYTAVGAGWGNATGIRILPGSSCYRLITVDDLIQWLTD